MVSSFKYRVVAILLAGIFNIFSVGIPIVLTSCPIIKVSVIGACCSQKPTDSTPMIKLQRVYSCCKTIIAADRNIAEFLQAQTDQTYQLLNFAITAIFSTSNNVESTTFSKIILTDTHSPPLIEDIPIFTSSLLI